MNQIPILFAGWDFTGWERVMIAGVLVIPIAIILLLVGLVIRKKSLIKASFLLLLLGLLDLFVLLPNF